MSAYTYDPATIGTDIAHVVARIERYCRRHGSPYGETPIPADCFGDVVQGIVTDWLATDWTEAEFRVLTKTGRLLFDQFAEPLVNHLRAALFICGRWRKRYFRDTQRKTATTIDPEAFSGASESARAADPARLFWAVENARDGLRSVPRDSERDRLRWMRTRRTIRVQIVVQSRHNDRTEIAFERYAIHNYRLAGSIGNRQIGKTLKRLPAGWGREQLSEALNG